MSVDLPEPEEPMMATNSPGSIARSTPRSACTSTSPITKVRVTFSSLRTGSGMLACVPRTSEARQGHRSAAGGALLADDHLFVCLEIATDDLGEILVIEPDPDR